MNEWFSIGISVVVFMGISLWATHGLSGKRMTPAEYYLARGRMTKPLIFFTFFATYFSAFTVVGLPAMFFSHGIGASLFLGVGVLLTPVTIYVFGYRIVDAAKDDEQYTSPVGLLTSPYRDKLLSAVVATLTVVLLIPYMILQISGMGKFFVGLSDGQMSYLVATVICCLIVGFYIYRGGAIADARTDEAQGILMFVGAALLGILVVLRAASSYGDGVDLLREKDLLSLPGPQGYFTIPTLISYGVIFGLISVATPQVSSKLMGASSRKHLRPSMIYFPLAGLFIICLAGLFGLYAAAYLDVSSPDLVIGDVLRNLTQRDDVSGLITAVLMIVGILFVCGIMSAAVSTIDSLLLSIAAIISEHVPSKGSSGLGRNKLWMAGVLLLSLLLSFDPPRFIADLAKVQVGGLMALLPCILAPFFVRARRTAGWLSVVCGIGPLIAAKGFGVSFWGFDVGLINLLAALVGFALGTVICRVRGQ